MILGLLVGTVCDHLQIRISEKLIYDAQNDSKRAKDAIKMAQSEILLYKERNRRLEADAKEAREETYKVKDGVLKKTEEIKKKIEEVSLRSDIS